MRKTRPVPDTGRMNHTGCHRRRVVVWLWAICAPAGALAGEAPASCVTVEVNGERVLPLECLTRKLSPPAPRAGGGPSPELAAQRIAQRPAHELGQVNQAATQHRMGNAWGRSVIPQRPPVPPPAPPRIPGGR